MAPLEKKMFEGEIATYCLDDEVWVLFPKIPEEVLPT